MVQQLSTNTFGTAKWIVSPTASDGTHTTIAAALTSASSGDTIFIRPGTYAENLTLKAGVNLCAYGPSFTYNKNVATIPNVIINGKCTFTAAGNVGIDGICLQTNSDFALAVTGSAASVVILNKCFLNCTNNTGISFTTSSSSANIQLSYCGGDLGTTGIALFAHSSAGDIRFLHSSFSNSGTSTTNNTVSGTGNFFPNYSSWGNGTNLSSSGIMSGSYLDLVMVGNQTAITTSSTSTVTIQQCNIATGTASAISCGSGTTVTLLNCMVNSANASTITGSGTLAYTTFGGNSALAIGTSIIPSPYAGTDALRLIQTKTASSSANLSFTTGFTQFSRLLFILDGITPATNAQVLQMQVSTNGGSSYLNASYVSGINTNPYNSTTLTNGNSTTLTRLSGSVSSAAVNGSGVNGFFYYNVLQGALTGQVSYVDSTAGTWATGQIICSAPTSVANAYQFTFASGNIASGTISIYGITA